MKAILIGATGATGKELLQQLLENSVFTQITVLVRRPIGVQSPKLQVALVDFDKPEQWVKYVTGDVAFSCLGTTIKNAGSKEAQYKVDYGYQYAFAKAAAENGVARFVLLSAASANHQSLVFYSRMKGQLENAVRALKFKELVIFRPGLLLRPDTDRTGERVSASILNFLNGLGILKSQAPLPVNQLAALLLQYGIKATNETEVLGSARILEEVRTV